MSQSQSIDAVLLGLRFSAAQWVTLHALMQPEGLTLKELDAKLSKAETEDLLQRGMIARHGARCHVEPLARDIVTTLDRMMEDLERE